MIAHFTDEENIDILMRVFGLSMGQATLAVAFERGRQANDLEIDPSEQGDDLIDLDMEDPDGPLV